MISTIEIDDGDVLRMENLKSDIEQELKMSGASDDIWAWAPVALEFLTCFIARMTKTQCPECKHDFSNNHLSG